MNENRQELEPLLEEWSKKIQLLRETISRGEPRFKSDDYPPLTKLKEAFDAASAKVKHLKGESTEQSDAVKSAANKSIDALMQELKSAYDAVASVTGATTKVEEPEPQRPSDAPETKNDDNKNAGR
ncbi:MAG: hypothetical protein IAF08_06845 [Rhizobacter sp.]|nr:hypothetical protein [Chlorobiales bacterium]